jgi:peptidoglycan/LPS O-acetylase OafA/YrhL
LRGIAVLGVIFYHVDFVFTPGGFLGVDLFFAISGYLITQIILIDLNQNRFSFLNFWERRIRRIFPMLFFSLSLTFITGFLILDNSQLEDLILSLFSSSFFLSNVYFYFTQNYFSPDQSLTPLLHTWSLGVEMQYYFILAPMLFFIWKYMKKNANSLLLLYFGLTLVILIFYDQGNSNASFYLLPFRAWELTLGSVLAIFSNQFGQYRQANVVLLQRVGLILILIPIFLYDILFSLEGIPMNVSRGICLMGFSLVILGLTDNMKSTYLLKNRILVKIGLSSYSSYLIHQPVIAFIKTLTQKDLSFFAYIFVIIMILLASLFTYRYVETPFRNPIKFKQKSIFLFAALSIFSLSAVSFGALRIIKYNDFPTKEQKVVHDLLKSDQVYYSNMNERIFVKELIDAEYRKTRSVIIGSSRVMQVMNPSQDNDTLNLGVSGASMEDLISITDQAASNLTPKMILIGLDPWILNQNSGQQRWFDLKSDYDVALKRFAIPLDYAIPRKQIIYKYIYQSNSKPLGFDILTDLYIFSNISYKKSYVSNNPNPELLAKKLRDGTHIYDLSYLKQSDSLSDSDIISSYRYGMNNYAFSQDLYDQLYSFLLYYSKSSQVVLLLPPYLFLDKNVDNIYRDKITEIESKYLKLAKDLDLQIIGSYNSSKIDCNKKDFYDGMHPKPSCFSKLKIRYPN